MTTYIAMLRGVNVGGKNKLPNAKLKEACERAGFADVTTYLQSGNAVFNASGTAAQVAAQLKATLHLDVAVIVRTEKQLRALLSFASDGYNPSRLVAVFLDAKLPAATQAKLRALFVEGEHLDIRANEIIAYFPDGLSKSKLAAALHDKSLGVPCTVRNWNTVRALADRASV